MTVSGGAPTKEPTDALGVLERLCADRQAAEKAAEEAGGQTLDAKVKALRRTKSALNEALTPLTVAALTRAVRAALAFDETRGEWGFTADSGPAAAELRAALAPFVASPPDPLEDTDA